MKCLQQTSIMIFIWPNFSYYLFDFETGRISTFGFPSQIHKIVTNPIQLSSFLIYLFEAVIDYVYHQHTSFLITTAPIFAPIEFQQIRIHTIYVFQIYSTIIPINSFNPSIRLAVLMSFIIEVILVFKIGQFCDCHNSYCSPIPSIESTPQRVQWLWYFLHFSPCLVLFGEFLWLTIQSLGFSIFKFQISNPRTLFVH